MIYIREVHFGLTCYKSVYLEFVVAVWMLLAGSTEEYIKVWVNLIIFVMIRKNLVLCAIDTKTKCKWNGLGQLVKYFLCF